MEDRLKKRLIGAVVLVALLVIFLPMLVEREELGGSSITRSNIPPRPEIDDSFRSRVLPDRNAPLIPLLPPKPHEATAEGEASAQTDQGPAPQPPVASPSSPAPTPAPPSQRPSAPAPAPAVAEKPASGVAAWVVQVASYTTSDKAHALAGQLSAKGFTAFVEPAHVNGKDYFRVRIGPEADRNRANRAAENVSKDLHVDAHVVRYP